MYSSTDFDKCNHDHHQNKRTLQLPPQVSVDLFTVDPPTTTQPGDLRSAVTLYLLWLPRILYKWNHTDVSKSFVSGFFFSRYFRDSFMSLYVSVILPFLLLSIFHCMDVQQSVHSFIYDGHLGCLVCGYMNKTALNILRQIFLGIYIFISLR